MKIAVSGFALGLLLAGAAVLPDEHALESIRVEDLKAELYFLASDEMQGRAVRSPANDLTADYIARKFEDLGLPPAIGSSYFQEFDLVQASIGPELRASVQARPGEDMKPLETGTDFIPAALSADGRVEAPVVFAGYGIAAPEMKQDDYRDLDVRGKIVLILADEPEEYDPRSRFDGLVTTDYGREFHKLLTAQRNGAVGVLIAPDVGHHPVSTLTRAAGRLWPEDPAEARPQLKIDVDQIRIPAVYISAEVAEELVAPGGRDLEELQNLTERRGSTPRVELQARAKIDIRLLRDVFTVRNVLATLPGGDPELKDEVVVVGAHFDHVGSEGDQIFNGADDNASGTVGLLEIAEAYAASRYRPRRTVLLAAWNAEERGLLGSYYYVQRPAFPLNRTVAMFQMDMIGRDEEVPEEKGFRFRGLQTQTSEENHNAVNILGYTRSRDLKAVAGRANRSVGLDLRFRYDNHGIGLLRRSDSWPFLTRGVPALFFHTGLHPDYHRPTDTADKINYEKLAKVVRLVYLCSWEAANHSERPAIHAFQPGGPQ